MRRLTDLVITIALLSGATVAVSQPPPPTSRHQLSAADEQLLSAAMEAELEIVKDALEKGANPNAHDEDGVTPVMWAAGVGDSEIVELLIKSGANAKALDGDDRSALHHAVDGQASNADIDDAEYQMGFRRCVEMLIKAGTDVNLKDRDGSTALSMATDANIRDLLMKARAR